jgi:hypothetical protein
MHVDEGLKPSVTITEDIVNYAIRDRRKKSSYEGSMAIGYYPCGI